MKIDKNKPFRWETDEINLIRKYYGSVITEELTKIIGKPRKNINKRAFYYEIPPNERMYGTVEIVFRGKKYKAKGFTYKKVGNSVINATETRVKRAYKTRVVKVTPSPKEIRITVNPQKAEKPNNARQQLKEIPKFTPPEGKVLVQLDNKTWVYR